MARLVVGYIHDSDHPGDARTQQRLDTLANGHLSEAAALATAFKLKPDPTLFEFDEVRSAAVGRNNRVDLNIEDATNAFGKASLGVFVQRSAAGPNHSYVSYFRDGFADQTLDARDQRHTGTRRAAYFENGYPLLDRQNAYFTAARDYRRNHAGLKRH
ncbi:MAG: hypothetical protein P8Y71_00120 [Pseudolabrys sp.]